MLKDITYLGLPCGCTCSGRRGFCLWLRRKEQAECPGCTVWAWWKLARKSEPACVQMLLILPSKGCKHSPDHHGRQTHLRGL